MTDDPILFALSLDGPRPGAVLEGEPEIARVLEAEELGWIHMQADNPASAEWIEDHMDYLPAAVREALLADVTRPRASFHGAGAMVHLRGVNTNPGAEPEDMVSLRLWIEPARIVTLSRRPLASIGELRAAIESGEGPRTAGAFLAYLVDRLNEKIDGRIDTLDEEGEAIEAAVLTDGVDGKALQRRITDTRQELVDLRRYLRPQREALIALGGLRTQFATEEERLQLTEDADRLTRAVEVLDGLAERLIVSRDEIVNSASDRLNRNLYILSVISAIFLPLGFLTGLMGINLAGMPGAGWEPAFWVFTGGLGVIFVVQVLILWRLRFV